MKSSPALATLTILLLCIPLSAQMDTARRMIATLPKAGPAKRDVATDKVFLDRHATIVTQLTATAKARLEAPVKALLEQLGKTPIQSDPSRYAQSAIAQLFPNATAGQTDLLTFYVLAETLRRAPPQAPQEDQGAGLNEISEMSGRRVQQAMDKRAKFTAALSTLMQKIEKTSDAIVKNMK